MIPASPSQWLLCRAFPLPAPAAFAFVVASLTGCMMASTPPAPEPREQIADRPIASLDPLSPAEPGSPSAAEPPTSPMRGIASWYGGSHQGKRTASGERFDRHALTAAHPTLPLKTCLSVFSPATGRRVDVRVNDRGPWIGGRILDLSEAAADAIGLRRQGTGEVILSACVMQEASTGTAR